MKMIDYKPVGISAAFDYARVFVSTEMTGSTKEKLGRVNQLALEHPIIIWGNHPSFGDVMLVPAVLPYLPNVQDVLVPMADKHFLNPKFRPVLELANAKTRVQFIPVSQKPRVQQSAEEQARNSDFSAQISKHLRPRVVFAITPGGTRDYGSMISFKYGLARVVLATPQAVLVAGAIQYQGKHRLLEIAEPVVAEEFLKSVKNRKGYNDTENVSHALGLRVAAMLPNEMRGVFRDTTE